MTRDSQQDQDTTLSILDQLFPVDGFAQDVYEDAEEVSVDAVDATPEMPLTSDDLACVMMVGDELRGSAMANFKRYPRWKIEQDGYHLGWLFWRPGKYKLKRHDKRIFVKKGPQGPPGTQPSKTIRRWVEQMCEAVRVHSGVAAKRMREAQRREGPK